MGIRQREREMIQRLADKTLEWRFAVAYGSRLNFAVAYGSALIDDWQVQ